MTAKSPTDTLFGHIIALMLPLLVALSLTAARDVGAQDFSVEPDSLEGVGAPDELYVFASLVTNLWDQENRIHWRIESDVPDDWTVEICQGTLLCWPPWVESDTLVLPANGRDTLLVKFRTGAPGSSGSTTIFLTPVADTTLRQQYTFSIRVLDLAVRGVPSGEASAESPRLGLGSGSLVQAGRITIPYFLPRASTGRLSAFDISGRAIGDLWTGVLNAGDNRLQPRVSMPEGVYILRLDTEFYGSIYHRIVVLR